MAVERIDMVDLRGQYRLLKGEIDAAVSEVLSSGAFINGPQVKRFVSSLEAYSGARFVIPCGNGTDALQIALMALGLERGNEVIVPAFTYVATAEVVALLGLVPVMVDVDYDTFNIDVKAMEAALSPRTRAVVPVHLFGQSADMSAVMDFASRHGLYVVEDNAQAMGADVVLPAGLVAGAVCADSVHDGVARRKTGTVGHIGCTSFFPSKNLGCYGDGGALFTDDETLAERCRMIANHGQKVKYHHSVVGCNSRLDTLQAAVLEVKLRHLDAFSRGRYEAACRYRSMLDGVEGVLLPVESDFSTHVYHQFTLRVLDGRRDAMKDFLASRGVPSMIYYPLPLQEQEAFKGIAVASGSLDVASRLCSQVLSLPVYPEITEEIQSRVADAVRDFFKA